MFTEKRIQCELCNIWTYLQCANLQKNQYNAIDKAKIQNIGIRFFCQPCNTNLNNVISAYQGKTPVAPTIQDNKEHIEAKLSTVENRFKHLEETYMRKWMIKSK